MKSVLKNLLTWGRSLGVAAFGLATGVMAAPAGTFDPHTTAVAAGVAAMGAALGGASHLGLEAVNPNTWPQTALTVAAATEAVAPGTQAAAVAKAVTMVAPIAASAVGNAQAALLAAGNDDPAVHAQIASAAVDVLNALAPHAPQPPEK